VGNITQHIKSAVGTMHMIWTEPTALFNIFSFYTGLKPGATILVEPMALKNKEKSMFRTLKVLNPPLYYITKKADNLTIIRLEYLGQLI
jgi:hypothetical protein